MPLRPDAYIVGDEALDPETLDAGLDLHIEAVTAAWEPITLPLPVSLAQWLLAQDLPSGAERDAAARRRQYQAACWLVEAQIASRIIR